MTQPPLLVLLGATAVGKTDLAIALAQDLNAEIISADSRLLYRGMDIGTAKPSLEERKGIPHHLIDVADPNETWSLAQFQAEARLVIQAIHQRNHLPLLVGGTGQYVRAVTQGWTPPPVQADPRLRQVLENLAAQNSPQWLHDKLRILDPLAAAAIDARNLRRTVRALEVIFSAGRAFSAQRGQQPSPYRLIQVGLQRPRPELYARIDARIEAMFQNGFLQEVQTLLNTGYDPSLPSLSAIGYREAAAVLRGEMSEEEAKAQMRRLTRIFVRRQANWFKEGDSQIRWFEAGENASAQVKAYLASALNRW